MVGKQRQDDFLQGRRLRLPVGRTPFTCLGWSGKKYQGALLYLEEPLPLFTAKLKLILYTSMLSLLPLLLSPLIPLPFIHCRHARPLPPYKLYAHTSRTALFLKGAAQLLQQWQLETHRQNLNPLLFHWSHRCGSILDFQWVMLTKKPQFASSAETRWQVILFKFPNDWRYNLLHYVNVLNLTV